MKAEEPFDATALADTVLRSSDKVHFYVLGAFLRYASPAFRDLFSLGQGSAADKNEIKDGYAVIPFPEDSKTIRYLLSVIHPYIDKPKLDDSRLLIKVWKMAEKYGINTVVGKLQKQLLKDQWMKTQPHRVFAIAMIFGWKDGAERAKQSLASWISVPYCDEFEDISGTDYYDLLKDRFHGCDGASDSAGDNVSSDSMHSTYSLEANARDASEPFNSNPVTDIILQSSDAVDFYVSRPFLQIISPAFAKLFSGTTGSDVKSGLSVIHVADHSEALRHFLLLLHHRMDKPPANDPGLIADICMVARKYDVPAIEARMKERLTASSLLVKEPLRVYAIATALGWADVAKAAAKNTLNAPLEEAVICVPELRRITGGALYRLVNYRSWCARVARGIVEKSQLHLNFGPKRLFTDLRDKALCELEGTGYPDAYWSIDVVKDLTACPRGSTYTSIYVQLMEVLERHHEQHYWRVRDVIGFVWCQKSVEEAIEKGIDKVAILS